MVDEGMKVLVCRVTHLTVSGIAAFSLSACSSGSDWLASLRKLFGDHTVEFVAAKTASFHEDWEVDSLAFSPDGKRLAASSPNSSEVHVWELQGAPYLVQRLEHPKGGSQNGLRYSSDGRYLACAHGADEDGRLVSIWNTNTGAISGEIIDHLGKGPGSLGHAGLAFSPDGGVLMRSQMGTLPTTASKGVTIDTFVVHDTTTWALMWSLNTVPFQPDTLGISPDGRFVALAGTEVTPVPGAHGSMNALKQQVVIVDQARRQVARVFDVLGHNFDVLFAVWSPDSQRIAVGGIAVAVTPGVPQAGAAVEIFDAGTGRKLAEYTRRLADFSVLAYSPDGQYLVMAWDSGLEIWDAEHTRLLQQIPGRVTSASFSRDGRHLAVATLDHKIGVWEFKQLQVPQP